MYTLVNPNNLENHWYLAAPWIAQAIGSSDTWQDLEEIKGRCKQGLANLWIGRKPDGELDVVLVTETWILGGMKTLVLRWLCGKDMSEWIEDYPVLETFAAANGFSQVNIWGRKGFEKICKPLGFEHAFTVLSKPIIRGLH